MKILAMDTAAAATSVAIWQDGAVSHHVFQEMTRGHASDLLPMVEALLQEASLKVEDFDALAVTVGPGAFTGLRIGLACARGFSVAAKLPVIGVTTLEALQEGVKEKAKGAKVLCALDAKRSDLYAQFFDQEGNALSEAVARLPEDVVSLMGEEKGAVIFAGDCFDRIKNICEERGFAITQSDVCFPDARYVAAVAAKKGMPPKGQERPSAFYIRPPDAELPKNGGRLRP